MYDGRNPRPEQYWRWLAEPRRFWLRLLALRSNLKSFLCRQKRAHLPEKAGAILGIHGDDLNRHAAIFLYAADDRTAAHLASGHVHQNLHGTAERHGLFGTHIQA